jgi:hypothetical protein
MSQLKQSSSKSGRIASTLAIAALVAVFSGMAVDARSKFSSVDSGASAANPAAQASADASLSDTYYFPAQFKEPDGAPSEPIDTF